MGCRPWEWLSAASPGKTRQNQVRKLEIAICDDETAIQEQIKAWIVQEQQGISPKLYGSGDSLLADGTKFDIIFLDIQMEGANGIETARMLRERDEEAILIFITGIREYVFDAFEVAAFHYLLKPIEEQKFRQVFRRAVRELEKRGDQRRELLVVKTKRQNIILEKGNIYYVESRGKKVAVHTAGETIEVYSSMHGLAGQLGTGFYRCHRSYLVNMAYVAEYSHESIILSNGAYVYLAKEKYGEFVKAYMRYLRGQAAGNSI